MRYPFKGGTVELMPNIPGLQLEAALRVIFDEAVTNEDGHIVAEAGLMSVLDVGRFNPGDRVKGKVSRPPSGGSAWVWDLEPL